MAADPNIATPSLNARRLICAGCGADFSCDLSRNCWCADEPFALPIPDNSQKDSDGDCLCRDCLRAKAAEFSSLSP